MTSSPTDVAQRLAALRARVAEACRRAGRAPSEVTLLAVSKRQPIVALRAAAAAGQRDFGENLVQAWRQRLVELPDLDLRWHLVGALQTNKARHVAAHRPALIHAIDRESLVAALDQHLASSPPLDVLDVLIQVNVDEEPQKAGCLPRDLLRLADRVAASPRLRLRGLMCIPRPLPAGPPRAAFARTRGLLEHVADHLAAPAILSMGMTDDFEAAIAEGSTLIRLGTAVFGARPDRV